jgi:hypothetical protein
MNSQKDSLLSAYATSVSRALEKVLSWQGVKTYPADGLCYLLLIMLCHRGFAWVVKVLPIQVQGQ